MAFTIAMKTGATRVMPDFFSSGPMIFSLFVRHSRENGNTVLKVKFSGKLLSEDPLLKFVFSL